MGEIFISGLFQAIISAIASGAALMIISRSLDKNNEDTKKAHSAEKELLDIKLQNLENKITSMETKFTSMEQKHVHLTEAFYEVKEKVVLMIQRQEEFKLRLFEVITTVEKLKGVDTNFGKVIVKK